MNTRFFSPFIGSRYRNGVCGKKMSQGQVNDIKNNAQFLGFKNDRGVIPLCYDFPCKFIKIK